MEGNRTGPTANSQPRMEKAGSSESEASTEANEENFIEALSSQVDRDSVEEIIKSQKKS